MKIEFEEFDESTMDIEDLQAERDLQLAAVDAIRRARQFGTMYVIWEDERVKEIPPEKTGPYEERLLESAALLDRRIVALKAPDQNAVLNDRPVNQK